MRFMNRVAEVVSGKRLTILIFHRVTQQPDPMFPGEMHAARFDEILRYLKARWQFVELTDAVDSLASNRRTRHALAITFDDGYADNAEVAAPILAEHGVPATVFVASGFLEGGRMWNDTVIEAIRRTDAKSLRFSFMGDTVLPIRDLVERRSAISRILAQIKHQKGSDRTAACDEVTRVCDVCLPNDLMMRPDQVQAISRAGLTIGAHTVTHPILAALPDDRAQQEIETSKRDLEALIGKQVSLFAYPNGQPGTDYLPKHVEMVKALGFKAAVSTTWGAAGPNPNLYELPRFTPWDADPRKFNLRLIKNLF